MAEPAAAAPDDGRPRKLGILWRVVELVRPHSGRFVLAMIALVTASGLQLVYPQAAKYAVDVGVGATDGRKLDLIVLALCGVFVIHAGLVWLRHYSLSWLGERVVADLRGIVVDRVMRLDQAWFHERRTGELVGRLASDVTVVEGVVSSDLSVALRNGIQLVGGVVLLFLIDLQLAAFMLVIVPPVVVTTVWFGRAIRRRSREVQDLLAQTSAQVQESIGAIQTVQSFVREAAEARRYRSGVERAFDRAAQLFRWRASFYSVGMMMGYVAVGLMIWLGGHALIDKRLTPGDLTMFFLYTFMVAGSLADIASLWGSLQRAAGATERLFAIVDTVPAIEDPAQPVALPAGGGAIRLETVDFAYAARAGHPVLNGVSFAVEPGEVVALVGPSGAGKSTVLSLLFRFHDVDAGRITFEGVDVRALRLADLRRGLAMVAQEPVLFAGTLRDNIAYARDGAVDQATIERAARDANAHDFITGFPDGYDTLIGERGVKLSGGQKQRIAIARALVADPRVLILDEATSNLDSTSEALVQQALARLMAGRTTLVVAHRLSTVRDADRIVVLDGGRVVEQGTHAQLMARAGVYRRLIEHQVIADSHPDERAGDGVERDGQDDAEPAA
jgi:ABC transporter fused permease/ATP-binding protein